MAANSSLNLTSLDFDTLKTQFKTWMQQQSVLKDYDYDGSNMNVLLDVMSYNTFLNSFYLNMIASEMFLDSAQQYDSIISHAKELNYTPRSAASSIANVNILFQTSGIANTSGKLSIPLGTRFAGTNANGTYQFVTTQNYVLNSSNDTFVANNLQISQGVYAQDSFIVDYNIENQIFTLSNKNIDTSTILVNVIENNGESNTIFTPSVTLNGLTYNSNIYFLQATYNGKYSLQFGDNNFGRKPKNSSTILAKYVVTSGSDGNGAETITLSDDLGTYNGGVVNTNVVTLLGTSVAGANQEGIESVRFIAPRYFATQQRAVSGDDYSSLIYAKYGGVIDDVVVYGGQDVEPKKYGRVIVCLKPTAGYIVPDFIKNSIVNYLDPFIVLPNRVETADPDYYFVYLTSTVQYNSVSTSLSAIDVQTKVIDTIINYSNFNLEKFNSDLRYSRLVTDIDDADKSIVSNDTTIRLIKRLTPLPNYETSYVFETGNPFYNQLFVPNQVTTESSSSYAIDFAVAALVSSRFVYQKDDILYDLAYFVDDTKGNINVFAPSSGENKYLDTIGTVDYSTGTFTLNKFKVQSYIDYVSVYMKTVIKDFIIQQDKILSIEPNDIEIKIIEFVE